MNVRAVTPRHAGVVRQTTTCSRGSDSGTTTASARTALAGPMQWTWALSPATSVAGSSSLSRRPCSMLPGRVRRGSVRSAQRRLILWVHVGRRGSRCARLSVCSAPRSATCAGSGVSLCAPGRLFGVSVADSRVLRPPTVVPPCYAPLGGVPHRAARAGGRGPPWPPPWSPCLDLARRALGVAELAGGAGPGAGRGPPCSAPRCVCSRSVLTALVLRPALSETLVVPPVSGRPPPVSFNSVSLSWTRPVSCESSEN